METVRRLRERFPQLQDPPSDDICYATQNRQVAVKQMAAECDLMIVVGSRNSSNSVRLVEVALEHGAARRPPGRLRRRDRRGLARRASRPSASPAGASVPEVLVRDVLACLAERGYGDVQPVVAAEESAAVLPAQRAAPRPQGPRRGRGRPGAPRRRVARTRVAALTRPRAHGAGVGAPDASGPARSSSVTGAPASAPSSSAGPGDLGVEGLSSSAAVSGAGRRARSAAPRRAASSTRSRSCIRRAVTSTR